MGTIKTHGTDGEVMAPWGNHGIFLRGKRREVRVTALSPDEDDPLIVRQSLIGLTVPIIFTAEQVLAQGANLPLPPESVLTYVPEIVHALQKAGKNGTVTALEKLSYSPLDMFILPPGCFRFCPEQ